MKPTRTNGKDKAKQKKTEKERKIRKTGEKSSRPKGHG
jgi:hypothetical protein